MGYEANTMTESVHHGYYQVGNGHCVYQSDAYDTSDTVSSSSGASGRPRPITIEVAPPKVVQKGGPMWPPLVVSIPASPGEDITFQVMAQDTNGSLKNLWNDTYYLVQGWRVMKGEYLDDSNKQYAVFPDIVFNGPARKYRFCITTTTNYGSETIDICDNSVSSNPGFEVTVRSASTERGCK